MLASIAQENQPMKSLNHDTQPTLSFTTSYNIDQLYKYTRAECRSQEWYLH